MQSRQQTDGELWAATVAVRVPRDGPDCLASDAARRLATPTGIETVEVIELCGLDPALAATVATVRIHVSTGESFDADSVEARLGDSPGAQRVETVESVAVSESKALDNGVETAGEVPAYYGPPP